MSDATDNTDAAPPEVKAKRERKPKPPAPPPPRAPLEELASAPAVISSLQAPPLAPNFLHVPVLQIDPDPNNVRSVAPNAVSDQALRASLSAVGVLEPPTIRAHPTSPGRWMVVMGHRRIAAAKALGWHAIGCLLLDSDKDGATLASIQAAENMVRAPMHPVDRWAAVRRSVAGLGAASAHAAVGISRREGALFDRLSRMHPNVVALLRRLPAEAFEGSMRRSISLISQAPPDEQASAYERIPSGILDDAESAVARLAQSLAVQVITGDVAIFDLGESSLDWVEDLFADPTSGLRRYSTRNVKGFLREQQATLQALADAEAAGGHPIQVVEFDEERDDIIIPQGWDRDFYSSADKPLPKGSQDMVATYIRTARHSVGQVVRVRLQKKPPRASGAAGGTAGGDKVDRGPVTHKGLAIVADAQEVAIQAAVEACDDPLTLLAALVIAIGGSNVRVDGAPHNQDPAVLGAGWGTNRFTDLSITMAAIADSGSPTSRRAEAIALARSAITRLVAAPAPKRPNHSGKVALFLGEFLDAERFLPRLDTMEFFSEVAGSRLTDLCRQAGKVPGKTGAMRAAMAGALPLPWRPEEAAFRRPTAEEVAAARGAPQGGAGEEAEGEDDAPPVFGTSGIDSKHEGDPS